jgi:hypothetical protein
MTAGGRREARIKALSDWRGETLARIRSLIKEADPEMIEAWKWRGVPVWEHEAQLAAWVKQASLLP